MKKKLYSIVLSLTLLLGISAQQAASAAGGDRLSINVDYVSGMIEVTYTSPLAYDAYVTIYVAEPSSAEVFVDFENAVRIAQEVCEAGESVTIDIKIDDSMDGFYDIFAAPSGVDGADGYAKTDNPVAVIGSDSRSRIMSEINAASSETIGQVIYDNLKDILYLSSECPDWKSEYLYAMKNEDCGGAYSDFTQIDSAWQVADYIHSIRMQENPTDAMNLLEAYDLLELDIANSDYTAYKEAFAELFCKKLDEQDVMSGSVTEKIFAETAAVTAVNNRNVQGKAEALDEYAEVLGISDLADEIEDAGAASVARQLDGLEFETAEEIKDKIEEVLDKLSESSQGNNDGGGGGGGGGNRGNSSNNTVSFPVVTAPAREETTEPEEEQEAENRFTDVPEGYWAAEAIEYLADRSVISGFPDQTFRGGENVNREEFVTMTVKAFDITSDGEVPGFTDVEDGYWAAEYIKTAAAAGIISGIDDTSFGISRPITRQDAAAVIERCMEYKGIDAEDAQEIIFGDEAEISDYALEAVKHLSGAGIINGYEDGTFGPQRTLTRAEAARIIYGVLQLEG